MSAIACAIIVFVCEYGIQQKRNRTGDDLYIFTESHGWQIIFLLATIYFLVKS